MKGGIACSIAASLEYLAANGGEPRKCKGSISFLITGDEEDIAVNGTDQTAAVGSVPRRKIRSLRVRRTQQCRGTGECIKVGRRGSLSGTLYVDGIQGHVAYPHRASNPVPDIAALIRR